MSGIKKYTRDYDKWVDKAATYINTKSNYVYLKGGPYKDFMKYLFLFVKKKSWTPWNRISGKRELFLGLFYDASMKMKNDKIKKDFIKYYNDGIVAVTYDLLKDACETKLMGKRKWWCLNVIT